MEASESQDAILAKDRQIAQLGEALQERTALVDRQIAMIADLRYKLILQGFIEKPVASEDGETLSQVQRDRQRLLDKVAELTAQLKDTAEHAEQAEGLRRELEATHATLRQQILEEVSGPQFSQQLLSQQLVEEASQPNNTEFYQLEIQRLRQQLSGSDAENNAFLNQIKIQCNQIEELNRRIQQSEAIAERMVTHYKEMEAEHGASLARIRELEEYRILYEEASSELSKLKESAQAERRMSTQRDKLLSEELETASEQLKESQRRFEQKAIALEGTLKDLNRLAQENQEQKEHAAALQGQISELTTAASQLEVVIQHAAELAHGRLVDAAGAEERTRQVIAEAEEDAYAGILGLVARVTAAPPAHDVEVKAICRLFDTIRPGHAFSVAGDWGDLVLAVQSHFDQEQQWHCSAAVQSAETKAKDELHLREEELSHEFSCERKAWKEKVDNLQEEIESRTSEAVAIQGELDEIRNHVSAYTEKYEKLVQDYEACKQERDQQAATLVAERHQTEALRAQIEAATKAQQHLEERLAESLHSNQELSSKYATLELSHSAAASTKPAQPDTPKRNRIEAQGAAPPAAETSPAKKPRVSPAQPLRAQSSSPAHAAAVGTPPVPNRAGTNSNFMDLASTSTPAAATGAGAVSLNQRPVVMLSGFKDGVPGNRYTNAAKADAARVVAALSGTVSLEHADRFDVRVSHVVSPPSARTLKTLAAAVTGKWIVGISWIQESQRANVWVSEAPHGRRGDGDRLLNKNVYCSPQFQDGADKANRMHHARQLVETYGRGHLVNDFQSADIVFVGSRENRAPYGDRQCLTWEEFIEFIYPKTAP